VRTTGELTYKHEVIPRRSVGVYAGESVISICVRVRFPQVQQVPFLVVEPAEIRPAGDVTEEELAACMLMELAR
jgi:hypothetical protein